MVVSVQASERLEECVIETHQWFHCQGQIVKLKGFRPQPFEIMQHPLLDPFGVQSYLNVDQKQVIVLSKTAIECADEAEIEVVGKLDKISLGGPPGTKSSYQNWLIRVTEFQCLSKPEK